MMKALFKRILIIYLLNLEQVKQLYLLEMGKAHYL